MRVAVAQMPMAWTLEENTRAIVEHLSRAKALGAEVALFPECATTGFHRRVPGETSPGAIRGAIERVREACRALALPAVVGTPFFPEAGESPRWNAAVAIGADGEVRAVCPKVGLTASEHAYFDAGAERPTFTLGAVLCGVLLCREVRDAEEARHELRGSRVVFWPGAIAWDNPASHPENVVTREIAQACARTLGAYLVQCNWATSLNDPETRGLGGSLVVSPAGEVVHACPADAPGITLVALALADVEGMETSAA
ncbi:MAG TPA: carbon-nitrogen hydrolase family protein [Longimicrobium sp.]|nr:carbon-nitrogen hydrolase family protein [Longimicrobium sp.]